MWERGDKTNQGIAELNGSSIGMAKVGGMKRRCVRDREESGFKSQHWLEFTDMRAG